MSSEQQHTKQSGSVISFLIVGVVLVGLVAGGLYVLHRQGGDTTPKGPAVTTSKKPSTSSSPAESKKPTPTKSTAPAKESRPSPKPQQSTAAPVVPLPQTGPADNMLSGAAFAILLGVAVAYLQSRRAKSETLYR